MALLAVRKTTASSSTRPSTGQPASSQSGISSLMATGSSTAPEKLCAPTSDPFSIMTIIISSRGNISPCFRPFSTAWLWALRRFMRCRAAARLPGPAPTNRTSTSICSRSISILSSLPEAVRCYESSLSRCRGDVRWASVVRIDSTRSISGVSSKIHALAPTGHTRLGSPRPMKSPAAEPPNGLEAECGRVCGPGDAGSPERFRANASSSSTARTPGVQGKQEDDPAAAAPSTLNPPAGRDRHEPLDLERAIAYV